VTVTAPATGLLLDVPGVYDFISNADYHSDPVAGGSLSSSGARDLLPPSCPAKFQYKRMNPGPPPAPKHHYDFGHAAHRLVLCGEPEIEEHKETEDAPSWRLVKGDSVELVIVDADNWMTKVAKNLRDLAHAKKQVPLLAKEYTVVQEMAAAIKRNPLATALLSGPGNPERTLIWRDENTGVMCRARPDWMPDPVNGKRLVLAEYKSSRSAEQDEFAKAVYDYGYYQQADWYLDGVRALGIDENPAFVFVVQEKDPPYIVSHYQLDPQAVAIAAAKNRWARQTYAHCKKINNWPAYTDKVELLALPAWAERKEEGELH
jgi:hypothetical protein